MAMTVRGAVLSRWWLSPALWVTSVLAAAVPAASGPVVSVAEWLIRRGVRAEVRDDAGRLVSLRTRA